jgi:predicted glycoside hydrolase/deacetylase ChbG (UPF0249 family)
MSADCASEIIIQEAPTDWIVAPRFDTVLAAHTVRNTRKRNGDSAETCGAPAGSGSVGAFKELWGVRRSGHSSVRQFVRALARYDVIHAQRRKRTLMRLVVNGDDFGLSESINDGIIRAHTHGILTSTSIVAAGAAFDHAVALARAHPTLDVGVHLTLTEEHPAAPVESVPSLLTGAATLPPGPSAFVVRFLRGAIALRDVALEFDAQVARVRDCGISVTHLDGHQHLHVLPGIRREVARLAQRHGIRFVRRPRERLRRFMLADGRRLDRTAALIALNLVCPAPQTWGALTTDHFAGFYFGGRLNTPNLMTQIAHLPKWGCCELMCHPGADSAELQGLAGVYDRRAECAALCDPKVRLELNAKGVDLISFADLGAGD